MSKSFSPLNQDSISLLSLLPFLIITFGISWGILGLYIALPESMNAWFGNITGQHPLFFLAIYAPAIAAILVVFYHAGWQGLKRYFSRLTLWRSSRSWYVFLILGIPLIFFIGAAIKGAVFSTLLIPSSFELLLVILFITLLKGPVEELGWRGLMLPVLQRKLTPFWAGLILGIIWGIWHLPAFFLSGTPQGAWDFMPFFTGSIAISIIITALFNASNGSILLAALFHFQLINPFWPDAQPYDTYILIIVALIIVWYNRKTMFSREKAMTEVIPS